MQRRGRRIVWIAGLLALLLLLAVGLLFLAQPQRATSLLLDRLGRSLGLEITATGGQYQLRGTPSLVVRGLVARQPGAKVAILRAERIHLSLPWSTVRARGADLTVDRVELDAPVLDVPALQAWLAGRPPGERRIPTLTGGLRIRDGRIDNEHWDVDQLDADMPSLYPDRPLRAHASARYLDPPLRVPVDLAIALSRPSALIAGEWTGFAARGHVTIERNAWQVPASVALSGPLRLGEDDLRINPARIALAGRYQSLPHNRDDATDLPFALGINAPLRFDEGTWTLSPAGVALRGSERLPDLDAHGAIALGRQLLLQLRGTIAAWPEAWPALPPPVGQSTSPLPFVLAYNGQPNLSDIARLQLRRDATRFDGRFRAFDVLAWIDRREQDSLLPPLDGEISAPRLEIAGAQLEGVEIVIDDPALQ